MHLVPQVTTRKGRLRIHILPSTPLDEEDTLLAATHNQMWVHVHQTEDRIHAETATQGEPVSFLQNLKNELHAIIAKIEGTASPVEQDLKNVAEKVEAQAEAEVQKEAPAVEAELKQDGTEAVAAVEQDLTGSADAPAAP
jgi:hypothetical protein